MKKNAFFLLTVTFLITSSGITLAADALCRMLHADEVEQFKKDQDVMIVGQLIDKQGDKFNTKVIKVLSGEVNSDSILVLDDFNYGWDQAKPSVNDFCVFSLKRSGDFYKKAWGIFKSNSGDYKTLKLESLNVTTPGLLGDLACIQWYVNTGGKENDFSFKSGTAFVKRPDGQVIQLYPEQTKNTENTTLSNTVNKQSIQKETDLDLFNCFILIILFALIVVITVIFVRWRKVNMK